MTSLDEWSAGRRELCVTTHNTQNRETSMPSAVFEPRTSASRRLQTHALDRTATGIDCCLRTYNFLQHSELLYIHHLRPPAHYIWRYVIRETEILVSLHNQIINPKTLQCETCSGSRCGLMERSTDHGRKYAAFINDRFSLWTQRMWSSQKRSLILAFTYIYLYSTETLLQPWLTYSGRRATFLVFNLSL
jgi:hypothetical protein